MKYVFVLFGFVFCVAACVLLVKTMVNIRLASSAATWPTAPGKIIDSFVDAHRGGKGGTKYELKLAYEYEVFGQHFVGSRLAFGYQGSSDEAVAQRICAMLTPGTAVDVRYDIAKPSRSTLSAGLYNSLQANLIVSISMLVVSITLLLAGFLSLGDDSAILTNIRLR